MNLRIFLGAFRNVGRVVTDVQIRVENGVVGAIEVGLGPMHTARELAAIGWVPQKRTVWFALALRILLAVP